MTSTASPQTDSSSSQAAAARAILQRRALRSLAKRDLSAFVTYFGEHRPAKHHRMLCTTLQMVIEGHLTRLMVFMPPGGAKSTYCSVYAPAFAVGRMPGTALIAGSHTMALARGFGRRVRNTIRDPRYREIFPTVLDPYARAAAEWHTLQTTEGDRRSSSYFAAGVGVGVAGKRADIAIIDDPFKSRKDADSQVKRDDVWNWYLADVRSRLRGTGGRIAVVNTRWHEDDLCGRILPEGYNGESGWIKARDGEWWFVISVQAIAERPDDILGRQPGESYWPDYVHIKALEQERITQTPRNWSALYQQRPSPEEGDYYKREWFQWYDTLPRHCHFFGASDYAVTQDGGDWTVHIVGAVTGPKQMESLYLVDYWTGQTSSDVWVEEFIRLVLQWKPLDWAEEQGQISKSLGPYIDTEQTRRRAWTNRKQLAVSGAGDKGARGQAFRALAAQRRVYLPRNAPWAGELLDRLLRFGATTRDDDHDACGLLGRLVYHMHGMAPPPPESAKPAYGSYDWLIKVTDEQQREAHRSLYHGANRR